MELEKIPYSKALKRLAKFDKKREILQILH